MSSVNKTDLKDFQKRWECDIQCGSCYYHGPLIPHNWLELPPPEWSAPIRKCPSFEFFKFKTYSAVGRGNLASLVFKNKDFPITDDLIKVAYTCTSCGMCSEICEREPLMAILALREELVNRGAQLPQPLENINKNILKYNNMFGATRAPISLGGVPAKGETIYFAGCNGRFKETRIARYTIKVLQAAGLDTGNLGNEEKCCGFVPGHDGNTSLLEAQAVKNVKAMKEAGAKRVVISCAHCYKTWKKDYPLIVGKVPFEVLHITEILARLVEDKKIKFSSGIDKQVTYQDPCFLGRHCGIYDEPRMVLSSIPGIDLIEMERNKKWSWCCGSGAKITSACYPEFTSSITQERLSEGKKAANTLVTACNSCFSHLNETASKDGFSIEIKELIVLIAQAMGITDNNALISE